MRATLIFLFVLLGVPTMSYGNEYYGDGSTNPYLGNNGWCHYDWYRPSVLAKQKSTLENGGQIKLQSRFQWMGSGNVPYVANKTGEHAVLGLTQGTQQVSASCPWGGAPAALVNSPIQPIRQDIHSTGVAILVSPKGLNLEIYSTQGTYVWNQSNNRCALAVPSGAQSGMCLSNIASTSGSYITENPNFTLQKGAYYWLRQTLTGNPDGKTEWVRLTGELLQQTANSTFSLQKGQLDFPLASVFPNQGTIDALIGRSGPEYPETYYVPDNILFWAFDYGF